VAERRRLLPAILALLFAGQTALVAVRFPPLIRLDEAVSGAARRFALADPAWRAAMSAITHTGDSAVLRTLAVLTLIVLSIRRDRAALLFVIGTIAAATGTRVAVLLLVRRARPVDRLTAVSGFSYPSGHTTSSAVAAGIAVVLGWTLLTSRRSRVVLAAVAGGWAVLVGVSRIALVAHWPSDVVGGWLLAAAVTTAAALIRHPTARAHGGGSPPSKPRPHPPSP
jgi:membrane-associated phospholipid phosphatase